MQNITWFNNKCQNAQIYLNSIPFTEFYRKLRPYLNIINKDLCQFCQVCKILAAVHVKNWKDQQNMAAFSVHTMLYWTLNSNA